MIHSPAARPLAFAALAAMFVAACQPAPAPAPTAETGPAALNPADFRATLSNQELMAHVIDYNADGIWLNQGWVVSENGTEELFPTTDAGWAATENAAATLAEVSNVLLLPGRPGDEDRAWIDYTHQMHDAALKAMKAAEARDKQAFFDAGGDIYVACRSCHARYVIGLTD